MTLPLVLFALLGTMQLFMLMHGRVMAQYAAFQATRAGSLGQGECAPMVHSAVLALLPNFTSFLGDATPGNSPGQKLAAAFGNRRDNHYGGYLPYSEQGAAAWGNDEAIVWIARERPNFGVDSALQATDNFDQPLAPGTEPTRLEIRLVYWAPLRIPFVDWVFARMSLARFGLQDFTEVNPIVPTQRANWTRNAASTLDAEIGQELRRRIGMRHYVFPIEATYSMRMMTPVNLAFFGGGQNCPPTPDTL